MRIRKIGGILCALVISFMATTPAFAQYFYRGEPYDDPYVNSYYVNPYYGAPYYGAPTYGAPYYVPRSSSFNLNIGPGWGGYGYWPHHHYWGGDHWGWGGGRWGGAHWGWGGGHWGGHWHHH